MRRHAFAAVVAASVLALGGAADARADQAVLLDFVEPIPPGSTIDWTFELVISRYGIPNVAYEHAETFAVGETVTARITPIVEPAGFGSVALTSDDTLVGKTSADWGTGADGLAGEVHFLPMVTLRYTAPSLADLDCARHPGASVHGHVGVMADFSGDAGTQAHIDPAMGGQGWVGAAVPISFECPPPAPSPSVGRTEVPAAPTPPATDATGPLAARDGAPVVLRLVGIAVLSLVVVCLERIRRRRPDRRRG